MLQSMGSQRVGHNLVTDNSTASNVTLNTNGAAPQQTVRQVPDRCPGQMMINGHVVIWVVPGAEPYPEISDL